MAFTQPCPSNMPDLHLEYNQYSFTVATNDIKSRYIYIKLLKPGNEYMY